MEGLIQKAVALAVRKHDGQTRKGPAAIAYTHHLAEVSALVGAFGGSPEVIAAAWLHDVVEDTDTSLAALRDAFGDEVAGLVEEVTDDPGLSKAARQAAQLRRSCNMVRQIRGLRLNGNPGSGTASSPAPSGAALCPLFGWA